MARFKSWQSYSTFSYEVQRNRRYVRSRDADDFLRTVAATCSDRLRPLRKGYRLWRAQLAYELQPVEDTPGVVTPAPAPRDRMKPRADRASEGRVNPKGIPCLYLSTTADAAMSEVRPWVGSFISVAQFEIVRDLTIVDCSVLHGKYIDLAFLDRNMLEPVPDDRVDDIVWARIDEAFSEPVTNVDDTAEYAATQIIAELFRSEEYDGVAYKSSFGQDAFSVAIFDLESAAQLDCVLYKTSSVEFKFEQFSTPYYVSNVAS
jgi:RES domain